jgi:hypothetical protein
MELNNGYIPSLGMSGEFTGIYYACTWLQYSASCESFDLQRRQVFIPALYPTFKEVFLATDRPPSRPAPAFRLPSFQTSGHAPLLSLASHLPQTIFF